MAAILPTSHEGFHVILVVSNHANRWDSVLKHTHDGFKLGSRRGLYRTFQGTEDRLQDVGRGLLSSFTFLFLDDTFAITPKVVPTVLPAEVPRIVRVGARASSAAAFLVRDRRWP